MVLRYLGILDQHVNMVQELRLRYPYSSREGGRKNENNIQETTINEGTRQWNRGLICMTYDYQYLFFMLAVNIIELCLLHHYLQPNNNILQYTRLSFPGISPHYTWDNLQSKFLPPTFQGFCFVFSPISSFF